MVRKKRSARLIFCVCVFMTDPCFLSAVWRRHHRTEVHLPGHWLSGALLERSLSQIRTHTKRHMQHNHPLHHRYHHHHHHHLRVDRWSKLTGRRPLPPFKGASPRQRWKQLVSSVTLKDKPFKAAAEITCFCFSEESKSVFGCYFFFLSLKKLLRAMFFFFSDKFHFKASPHLLSPSLVKTPFVSSNGRLEWSCPPQPAIKASRPWARPFGADNCQTNKTNKLSSLKREDGFYFENVDPGSSQAASFLSRCVLLLLSLLL